jgi:stage V sporulation protein G
VVIDNCFIVRDIKVIESEKGMSVSMPSRRKKDGTFKDVAHPLNQETRQTIERRVIEEYDKFMTELPERRHEETDYDEIE